MAGRRPTRSGAVRDFFSLRGVGKTWENAWDIAKYPSGFFALPLYAISIPAALAYGVSSTAVQLVGMACEGIWNGGKAIVDKIKGKSSSSKAAPRLAAGVMRKDVVASHNFGETAVRDQTGKVMRMVDSDTEESRPATDKDREDEARKLAALEAKRANGGKYPSEAKSGFLSHLVNRSPGSGVTITEADRDAYALSSSRPKATFCEKLMNLVRRNKDTGRE